MLSHLTIFGFLGFSLYKRNWKKNYAKGSLAAAIALLLAAPETFTPLKKIEKKENSQKELLKNQEFLAGSSFSNRKGTFNFAKNKKTFAGNNSLAQDNIKSAGLELDKKFSYRKADFGVKNSEITKFNDNQDFLKVVLSPIKEFFLKTFTAKKEIASQVPNLNIRQPPKQIEIVEREVKVPVYLEKPEKTFVKKANFEVPKTEIDLSPFENFIINRAKIGAFYEEKIFSKRDLKETFFQNEEVNDFGLKVTGIKDISWDRFFQITKPIGKINYSIAFWNNNFENINLIMEKIKKGENYDLALDDFINNKFGLELFDSEKEYFKNFLLKKDKNELFAELKNINEGIVFPNLLQQLEKQVNLDPSLIILREKYKDGEIVIKNDSATVTTLKLNPDFKDPDVLEDSSEEKFLIGWKLPWSFKNNLRILRKILPEDKKGEYEILFKEIEAINDKNVFEKNKKKYRNLLDNIFKKYKKEKTEELNIKKAKENEVVFVAKKKLGEGKDFVL